MAGYKRPDQYDKDDPVFDVLRLILSGGRTGLLYQDLVQDKQIALAAQAVATYPGGRYPNLFLFFLVPAMGHTVEENEKALDDLLAEFESHPVDEVALARAKTQARASVIRRLANNAGLASLLTEYYMTYGDWRKLFTSIDELNKVTAADVERVAQAVLCRHQPHVRVHVSQTRRLRPLEEDDNETREPRPRRAVSCCWPWRRFWRKRPAAPARPAPAPSVQGSASTRRWARFRFPMSPPSPCPTA